MRATTKRLAAAALAAGGVALTTTGMTIGNAGAANPTPVLNTINYTAPTHASLDNPMGVATDDNGSVYVANSEDSVVATIASGTTTVIAGSYDNSGAGGDGGPGTAATLEGPAGLAHDSSGDVFIADTENNRIREVTPSGTITTVAGNGNEAYTGDGGPATKAGLDNPQGVAVDSAGDLFIADTYNNVVREVLPNGTIKTFAGNGTAGYTGDGGQAANAELSSPTDVAVDSVGDVYIADAGNNVIRRVDPSGEITTAAGNVAADNANGGLGGYSGDGGPATAAQLNSPQGIALDRAGDLFIADTFNNRIREVTPAGVISTLVNTAGTKGKLSSTATNTPAGSAPLNSPYAVAVDNSTGDVVIADTTNNAIREVSGLPVPGAAAAGPAGVVGTATPPPGTPEAPLAAGLPLAALAIGGGVVLYRRRRNRSADPVTPA